MTYINEHYLKLTAGYLFPEIGRRVKAFCDANPSANVIRLGIGDVTEPLAPAVIQAMHTAVDELTERSSFRGYGPEQGYDFLREAIAEHDYQAREPRSTRMRSSSRTVRSAIRGISWMSSEKITSSRCWIRLPGICGYQRHGRTHGCGDASGRYGGLVYLPVTADNDFVPELPRQRVDLIYLCYPTTRLAWLPPRKC